MTWMTFSHSSNRAKWGGSSMQPKNTNGPRERAECENGEYNQVKPSNPHGQSQSSVAPSSIASERVILGAIVEDDDLIMPDVIASGLRTSDFYLSDHRRVFDSMLALWQEKKHIDLP